ncbi:MAG: ABC transporter permease [Chloroflexi bacterium]|nr:ABC transporter permease [Chloroflexota bacterium]
MILLIANLVRWEWFKTQRRWMPWILLLIFLLFSQLGVWENFFSYRNLQSTGGGIVFSTGEPRGRGSMVTCNDVLAGDGSMLPGNLPPGVLEGLRQQCQQQQAQQGEQLQRLRESFALPGSILAALSFVQSIGLVLFAILTASAFGAEYGWGTLRPTLAQGMGRGQYVMGKLAMLVLVAAAALVVATVVTALSSLAAGVLAHGASSGAPGASASWGSALAMLGRSWLALWPYIALVTFVTILTTSSAAGMAVALGYFFAEQIAIGILINVFDWFQTVADYAIVRNITAWMLGGQQDEANRATVGLQIGSYPSDLHALLVMAAYTLVLAGMALWMFGRRDVGGARNS